MTLLKQFNPISLSLSFVIMLSIAPSLFFFINNTLCGMSHWYVMCFLMILNLVPFYLINLWTNQCAFNCARLPLLNVPSKVLGIAVLKII